MQANLFDLSFEKWGIFLISIIPALINFGIYYYVNFHLAQNKTNRAFSIFVLLLGISQAADGIMRTSNTGETAYVWNRISFAPWVFTLPFGLLFALRFTEWHKNIHYGFLMMILMVPSAIMEMIIIARLDDYTIVASDRWKWVANPGPTLPTLAVIIWILLTATLTLFLFWFYFAKEKKSDKKRKQLFLLALGYTVPFIMGILFEVIYPLVLGKDGIPLTTVSVTAFSIFFLVAIKKHKLFDFSPKHQWDNIIEHMNEGVLIVNNNDMIMFANEAFCNLIEYEFHEIKGKIAGEIFLDDTQQKERIKNIIEERRGNKSSQFEIQVKTKTGKKIWILTDGSPYYDRKGKVIGSIGIHTNIKHLKEAEDNLKAANKELEIYIYKASHDLKAPLSSILGLIHVGRMEIKDPAAIKYFDMMYATTLKLDSMLSDFIKSMAIKDTNKFEDKINFNKLIEEAMNKMQYRPEFSRLKVHINNSLTSPFTSNKFILESILQNMVENALKYQAFEKPESFLKIDISEDATKVKIVIEDNGIGIEKQLQEKIFDMYFRATQNSKGSGLGLYLVKKGVEKLKGEVYVESTIGMGTTFTIELPLRQN